VNSRPGIFVLVSLLVAVVHDILQINPSPHIQTLVPSHSGDIFESAGIITLAKAPSTSSAHDIPRLDLAAPAHQPGAENEKVRRFDGEFPAATRLCAQTQDMRVDFDRLGERPWIAFL
jgi:hypothetical protein